jgi:undecaprenyl-diphosphatase
MNNINMQNKNKRLFFLWLGVLFGFGMLAQEVVFEGDKPWVDQHAIHFFQTHQTPLAYQLMSFISWVAGPVGLTLTFAVIFACLWKRDELRETGLPLMLWSVAGYAVVYFAKLELPRQRPLPSFAGYSSSFPSGHAFCAITLYGWLALWLAAQVPPGRRWVVYAAATVMICLVGLSRIFLGAHYPSDVAGGYLIGSLWLGLCANLMSEQLAPARVESGVARADGH